jgi:1-acyl-sn-glycerol-3-phosphate acyltransferase
MKKALSRFLLMTVWGFKIDPVYPKSVKKSVIIVYPHTSNWDFPIGILLRPALDLDTYFVAKDSLFKFPLGILMRWWHGVPVDRSKHNNFVDAVAVHFENKKSFKITLAPEGTRKKVSSLKSGFYYIAIKADVPIVCCKFDFGNKIIGFSEPFYPTGNYEKDLPLILSFFKGVKGKIPKNSFDI